MSDEGRFELQTHERSLPDTSGINPWREHAIIPEDLVLVTLAIFLICLLGQALTGRTAHNQDRILHGDPRQSLLMFLAQDPFFRLFRKVGLCHADRVFDPARLCGIEGSGQAFST
ncbi:DUF6766 family protein [Mesorhizobium sp.]|uniref:DUF6766 family protein n=1 Tax=Mesorhizobium sp. TaxID=1871066 RepID=UPI00121037FE|nr:DUF6766 family protein [Mesorhizobium sp.]TIS85736.1 MAG: hypothetical protein E5W89_32005 [Mesorhizobium sp.]